jgi:hypothetical protein
MADNPPKYDYRAVAEIKAPASRVFDVLCAVERWPEWTPTMSRLERIDSGPFRVGSKARVWQPKLYPATWCVTELDAPRSFRWVARSPGLVLDADHRIEGDESASRVTLLLSVRGLLAPLVRRVFGNLSAQYLALEAERLRKRCED